MALSRARFFGEQPVGFVAVPGQSDLLEICLCITMMLRRVRYAYYSELLSHQLGMIAFPNGMLTIPL